MGSTFFSVQTHNALFTLLRVTLEFRLWNEARSREASLLSSAFETGNFSHRGIGFQLGTNFHFHLLSRVSSQLASELPRECTLLLPLLFFFFFYTFHWCGVKLLWRSLTLLGKTRCRSSKFYCIGLPCFFISPAPEFSLLSKNFNFYSRRWVMLLRRLV